MEKILKKVFRTIFGKKAGIRRLEGEIGAFRSEFEGLVEEMTTDVEEEHWVTRGRELLDKADTALKNNEIEQGWYYLHAAERFKIYGLEAVEGQDALQGEARELLTEAKNAPLSWRADAIRERLMNDDGALGEVTGNDIRSAYELLHEGYQRIHLKRQHLQSQVTSLKWAALILIIVIVLFSGISAGVAAVPSPFYDFPADNSTESGTDSSVGGLAEIPTGTPNDAQTRTDDSNSTGPSERSQVKPVGFLGYIVLFGMLGASLFGLRSIRKRTTSGSAPQYLTGRQAVWIRLLIGAGSALAVFFLLLSRLVSFNIGTGVSDGELLIAFAFAAGFSERLVYATVESVASAAEPESFDGEGSRTKK